MNPKLRKALGVLWGIIGTIIMIIAVIATIALLAMGDTVNGIAIGSVLAGFFFMMSRRFKAKTAEEVLQIDPRPPVLYLRSFKEDSSLAKRSFGALQYTEEEYFAQVLNEFGPVIAIGEPEEKFPMAGAARMYFPRTTDEWQDAINKHMTTCRLVVLRAGSTRGLQWEIQKSIAILPPEKFILIVPKKTDTYRKFYELFHQFFPKSLPQNLPYDVLRDGVGKTLGYIYFDADWNPIFVPFRTPWFFQRGLTEEKTASSFRTSLAPIYARLKMPVPQVKVSVYGIVIIVAAVLITIWFCTLLYSS